MLFGIVSSDCGDCTSIALVVAGLSMTKSFEHFLLVFHSIDVPFGLVVRVFASSCVALVFRVIFTYSACQ
jgi:hypothetical protein